MTQQQEEMPDISMTNTKKEMLAAFSELKKQLNQKAEMELKPEKQKEQKHKVEVIKTADTLTTKDTSSKINELKVEIGKLLSQLSDKLEDEVGNYLKLTESIDLKKKELKEIYDIEESAYALAALIEAQKQKRQEFEKEMAGKRETLETEIQQKRLDWEKEKQEHDAAVKERDIEEKKVQERQKDEFQYNFKREQQLSKNVFYDEKEKMEKELAAAKEAFEKKITETEKSLHEREEKVKEREKLINDLQKQTEQFPAQLENAVNKAVKEVTQRLTLEAQKNEELLKKGYEGEKNVLITRIESLEQTVAQQDKQILDLSQRLEQSYNKVQDIAIKAIEGSASAQRLNNLEQHLMLERDRKSKQSQDSGS